MAKVVNLRDYLTKAIKQKGFGPWQKRFGQKFNEKTKLSDLSERILYLLALAGDESTVAFYELIMGILGLGKAAKFYYLDKKEQMKVVDIHLFLLDQVRFEMMRRLGWIDNLTCENYSLLEMVQAFDKVRAQCLGKFPALLESHPDHGAYKKLSNGDKDVFIRRLLPRALEIFKERLRT